MILDLGCGYYTMPFKDKCLRVDARKIVNPDVISDFKYLPFKSETAEEIYASHILEHCSKEETFSVLKDWLRVLKPDGKVSITVPNLEWACLQVANGNMTEDVYKVFYGGQDYRENFHNCGFTPKSLKNLLIVTGFHSVSVDIQYYNINAKGRK